MFISENKQKMLEEFEVITTIFSQVGLRLTKDNGKSRLFCKNQVHILLTFKKEFWQTEISLISGENVYMKEQSVNKNIRTSISKAYGNFFRKLLLWEINLKEAEATIFSFDFAREIEEDYVY